MVGTSPQRRFYFGKISSMSNLSNYLRETMGELKQVSWPSQKQAFMYTLLVIVISVFVSFFLGAFDFAFTRGIEFIVEKI
jgi:preprotein translocase subunit SecE